MTVNATDPQSLAQWLPPEGATCRINLYEPRPGGLFKMTLIFASHPGKSSSDTDEIDGQFVELVPGERVVQAITFVRRSRVFGRDEDDLAPDA